jgi:hypothetical protein
MFHAAHYHINYINNYINNTVQVHALPLPDMAVPGFRVRPSDRPLTETKDFALTGIDRHRQADIQLAAKVYYCSTVLLLLSMHVKCTLYSYITVVEVHGATVYISMY